MDRERLRWAALEAVGVVVGLAGIFLLFGGLVAGIGGHVLAVVAGAALLGVGVRLRRAARRR